MNHRLNYFSNRKRQRILIFIFIVSITVPLFIFKMNTTTIQFVPTSYGIWDIRGNYKFNDSKIMHSILETTNDTTKMQDHYQGTVAFSWCGQSDVTKSINTSMIDLDCNTMFSDDRYVMNRYKSWSPPCSYSDDEMSLITCDCDRLKSLFHFESKSLSDEERDFPLAFILVVEKHVEQVIRLLASLYQPQNIFCLNYDEHSNEAFKKSIRCVSGCFKNILVPVKHYEIFWGDISILDATMSCMELLVSNYSHHEWKYVQILSWNDIALRTNAEMVKIFKTLDGASDSELTYGQTERFRKYHYRGGVDKRRVNMVRPIPPYGVTVYKGSFAVSLPRNLCNYLINHQQAKDLFNWSRPSWCPEEQYFSTIIHNTHLNHTSAYPGTCLHYYNMEKKDKAWISRYQVWYSNCAGKIVSGSCCFGVGDLPSLKLQPQLVAHKFYSDFEPAAWYCMLKWRHDRTYDSKIDAMFPLNITFYENLPAVKYQKMVDKWNFAC